MSVFFESTVRQCDKTLANVQAWLDKAVAHAEARKFDPELLLASRLAPDQYPLRRQIPAACDQAKFIAARLGAKDPPKHPDEEESIAALRARIANVREYLGTYTEKDFDGAEKRVIPLFFAPGKAMVGQKWATQMAMPNFYFHITTTYAILRNAGVPLGKYDFIGSLDMIDV